MNDFQIPFAVVLTGCWTRGGVSLTWWEPSAVRGDRKSHHRCIWEMKCKRGLQNDGDGVQHFSPSYLWPAASHNRCGWDRMETLVFLFPQFNFMAQKEEAYFKRLDPQHGQEPTMKADSSRFVYDSQTILEMQWLLSECLYGSAIISSNRATLFCAYCNNSRPVQMFECDRKSWQLSI